MSLESEIAESFLDNGWTWTVRGKGGVSPSESDIQKALDEAVRLLYNEPVDTQLEVGRLIIKKKHKGYDVYMFVGEFD